MHRSTASRARTEPAVGLSSECLACASCARLAFLLPNDLVAGLALTTM